MAKRRKRKPPARRPPAGPRSAARGRTRDAEPEPRGRRSLAVRGAILVVVAVLGYVLLVRARGPGEIPAEAIAAAEAAGCDDLVRPVEPEPSRTHLGAGEAFTYEDPPAAAGPHASSPLPPDPHVYTEPVPETSAVHNLEHAYVLIYHRPSAEGGPSAETLAALEDLANGRDRVIMAPYADLPEGRGLALLAWNIRWMCPSSVAPDQAVAIASGFIDAFAATTVAPEAPRGLLGPLLQR